MSLYPKGTFSGDYAPQGDIVDADSVVGFEFAVPAEAGRLGAVHEHLGMYIVDRELYELPLILNHYIAASVLKRRPKTEIAEITAFDSSDMWGRGAGTLGEIVHAKKYLDDNQLARPLLLGQAFHIARIKQQAQAHGIREPIIPDGLPAAFDPESGQPQTRNRLLWAAHELLGVPYLHIRGRY